MATLVALTPQVTIGLPGTHATTLMSETFQRILDLTIAAAEVNG
jgi:hypothetical protein